MENGYKNDVKTTGYAMRVLALAGIGALAAALVWGTLQFGRAIPFSSIAENVAAAAVQITSVFRTASDESVPLSETNGSGTTNEDNNASFFIEESVEADEFTPIPSETIGVGGENSGGSEIGGTAPRTPGEQTEQTIPLPNENAAPDESGIADLAVRVIATGVLNPDTNEFTETETMRTDERGSVMFEVINLGTGTSDTWTFDAVLPTSPPYTFTSETQGALAPGDRIEFTLGFDSVMQEPEVALTITVDPNETLEEVTRDNNTQTATITVTLNN